jgi:hypothetical protein
MVKVHRVPRSDGLGSAVEPPLDPSWDDRTKLAWHAAVTSCDTGHSVRVEVLPGRFRDSYRLSYGGDAVVGQVSPLSFIEAWSVVSGIAIGVDLSRGRTGL